MVSKQSRILFGFKDIPQLSSNTSKNTWHLERGAIIPPRTCQGAGVARSSTMYPHRVRTRTARLGRLRQPHSPEKWVHPFSTREAPRHHQWRRWHAREPALIASETTPIVGMKVTTARPIILPPLPWTDSHQMRTSMETRNDAMSSRAQVTPPSRELSGTIRLDWVMTLLSNPKAPLMAASGFNPVCVSRGVIPPREIDNHPGTMKNPPHGEVRGASLNGRFSVGSCPAAGIGRA